jgi:hypothetical protein
MRLLLPVMPMHSFGSRGDGEGDGPHECKLNETLTRLSGRPARSGPDGEYDRPGVHIGDSSAAMPQETAGCCRSTNQCKHYSGRFEIREMPPPPGGGIPLRNRP